MDKRFLALTPWGKALTRKSEQKVRVSAPKPPANIAALFQSFTPLYAYNNGNSRAYFVKPVLWTQPGGWCGSWAGMYQTDMTGGGQFWTERYFWGFRNGSFVEIKQHGVRGPRKRMLRG